MRLIDADKLRDGFNPDDFYGYIIQRIIDETPAIDAVPVMRCRECKYRPDKPNQNGFLVCGASGMEISNEDFCSYGERGGTP